MFSAGQALLTMGAVEGVCGRFTRSLELVDEAVDVLVFDTA